MAGFNTIASVEYAVEHLNVPIVLFLGHESCGAVAVTIDRVVSQPLEASPPVAGAIKGESTLSLEPLRIVVRHHSSGSASDLAKEILHARTRGKSQLSKLSHVSEALSAEEASPSPLASPLAIAEAKMSGPIAAAAALSGGRSTSGGASSPSPRGSSDSPTAKHDKVHSRFLDNLVEGIAPAVRAVQQMTEEQGLPACTCRHGSPSATKGGEGDDGGEDDTIVDKPADFVRMCVEQNAILQCQETLALSAGVREAVRSGRCQVVPAYYSLSTGKVSRLELPDEHHGYDVHT